MLQLELHDYEKHFSELNFKPIMLNDLPFETITDAEALSNLVSTTYDKTDLLDSVPRCYCGALSYGIHLGKVCPHCNTRVESQTDQEIESTVWMRVPDGVRGFISPILWMMISPKWTKSKFNVLKWFLSPTLSKPQESLTEAHKLIALLEETGIPRGINSFIENFDSLIPILANQRDMNRANSRTPGQNIMELLTFLHGNKHKFFPRVLPVPNKLLFIRENTHVGNYADFNMKSAINACLTAAGLKDKENVSVRKLESQVMSIVSDLSNYYTYIMGKPMSSKPGFLRKLACGVSMAFQFRTVIVSESGIHNYDEISIPYAQAATMMRIHVLNKLRKTGLSQKQAYNYLLRHTANRDPLIEKLLMEIINDGMYVLWIRYPTLKRASIQYMKVIGLEENCSTLSVLSVNGANADFDGDVLSGCLAIDERMKSQMRKFSPHLAIHDMSRFEKLNNNASIPDLIVANISNWIEEETYTLEG